MTINKENKFAVGYCRFDTINKTNESIDSQKRSIQKYADENGITIIKWYEDHAQTGTNANRKQFQQMIEASKAQTFQYVIVHKLDRFSSNKYDSVTYKVKLKINNVRVVSATEPIDDSPKEIFLEAVMEGVAAYYDKNLKKEKKGR